MVSVLPCSFLCDSLATIQKQSDEARHQNSLAAEGRDQERSKQATPAADGHVAAPRPGYTDGAMEFGSFAVEEAELDD